ncbi:MAG: hypothetical protein CMF62_01125 [Magnetococcales bacterium]|nr:hypothetical protein [Magnetococcales bacterium]|tara:strand:+ start:5652 stop:6101 length:450 start_codon:yes stop_codon:yes gene_type:complete
MELIIKKASLSNIFELENCGKSSLPIYYNSIDYFNMILNPYFLIIIATIDNKLVGFVVIEYNDNRIHICSIGVYQNYRNKKIGSTLIKNIIKLCDEPKVSLYVKCDNSIAIKFYLKNEFVIIKKLDNYYENYFKNESNDAYYMEKTIVK